VPAGADPKRVALRALLAGPTTKERQAGYVAFFGPASSAVPFTITVFNGGLAVVDFDLALLNITPSGRYIFTANADAYQIVATLGQFSDVQRVTILVGGRLLCQVLGECPEIS
jgi:spore germination protein GerM